MTVLVNRLDKRIKIIRPPGPNDLDGAGQPSDNWQEVTTLWAAIEPLRGRDYESARQMVAEVTTRIRIRYREGIDRTMKAIHIQSGTEFDILHVLHPKFAKKELQLLSKEMQ
ncbi:head-tail adaptor [Halalkalibacter wakoensis JCM 9140]|uniref:Head-tail adaptor n=1 Tax=Halalkalibacter wakoensis JCM 9140 TaxID=1236970 RepID=W4Q6N4_9BACI|nr:phage head closure protein [Halalkalibacter wakoensis]GAE27024.1 head-tail adaptor [Halalkalibacter wakoensis JCM 9140]